MANAPVNIFSQHRNPEAVLEALKELLPVIAIDEGEAGGWSRVKGIWKRGWLKSALTMDIRHDPSYYAGDGWAAQLSGMTGFFSRFPDAGRRPDLFGYIPGLRFAVSFILDPAPIDDDPRQAVIYHIARLLDGVIFLPTCLLDSQGRAIVSMDGESDPEAHLPEHDPSEAVAPVAGSDASHTAFELPSEERVITRLVFMAGLVNRGLMESRPDGESARQDMMADFRESEAWSAGDPEEIKALETPVGQLPEKTIWQLPWLSEGAMVLAWALELGTLPSYDEQVDVDTVFDLAGRLRRGEARPALRPRSELEQLAFQMLAIHWRLRQYSVEPKPMNFEEYAPKAWCGPMDLSLAKLVNHDLAVNGQTLSKAPEEAWKIASGIMEERRKAIHWLLGHHPVYAENDTST